MAVLAFAIAFREVWVAGEGCVERGGAGACDVGIHRHVCLLPQDYVPQAVKPKGGTMTGVTGLRTFNLRIQTQLSIHNERSWVRWVY